MFNSKVWSDPKSSNNSRIGATLSYVINLQNNKNAFYNANFYNYHDEQTTFFINLIMFLRFKTNRNEPGQKEIVKNKKIG